MFDGGAIERYFPIYPFAFMALAVGLAHAWPEGVSDLSPDEPDLAGKAPSRRSAQLSFAAGAVAATFVIVAAAVNVSAMAKSTLDRQQEAVTQRIAELLPRLTPGSRVVVVHWQDDLVNFNRSFPFNRINRAGDLAFYSLLTLGTSDVLGWRQDFATAALSTWSRGGDVWISKRALNARPLSEWNWVEGSDERVSWSDVYDFFKPFVVSDPVGGDDGFVRLARDPQNHDRLVSVGESGQDKIGDGGRTN
jgi:hypothetical protein